MRIGIFGGTFNPPHIGHIQSAKAAMAQLGLDRLIVIPSGAPPHKALPAGTPSANERYNMALAAFGDIRGAEVSKFEIDGDEPKYTIDAARHTARLYPGSELFLLLGADMYLSLESWRDYRTLLGIAAPAVFPRGAGDAQAISEHSRRLRELFGIVTEIVENDVVDISSSELRAALPERKGAGYIKDTTYLYIIRKRLYGAKPDWRWLRGRAREMLDPQRVKHTAGCEEEAVRLAERWGADVGDAREAAILHDIAKGLDPAEQVKILEGHGVAVGTLGFAEEKLLHPKTGAVLAQSEFGASNEVAEAIRWHTTGKAGMSTLEKVIYLADYIEPGRDLPGVSGLRAAAYEDIDEAMRMGLQMTIDDVSARGIEPNMATVEALGYLRRTCVATKGQANENNR